MDDAAALFRIRVVMVSTRAAVRSLIPGDDPQLDDVLARARALLDDIESDLDGSAVAPVTESLEQARSELESIDGQRADRRMQRS
jgi:hypothetical protein